MPEGWEWIIIFGAGAMVMTAVLIVAILFSSSKPKIIVSQGYGPQYLQQPLPQYQMPTDRVCVQCGFSMSDGSKFCSNCGRQLNQT